MKSKTLFVFPLAVVAVLALSVGAFAQPSTPSYQLLTTITVPGGLGAFDIAWVDPGSQRFYLAARSTAGAGSIVVVDTQTNKLLYTIPTTKSEIQFTGTVPAVKAGCTISGPNGVVAIPQLHQLYVGDGDSTVKVVDLDARAIIAVISTGGSCRADELAYDPLDHIIMITNPAAVEPGGSFVTFISTDTQTVLGRYTYPTTQAGLEQPVWNPKTKRFYISVPTTMTSPGTIDVFNPITMLKENSFIANCSPAGLVLTPNQQLMTSCGQMFDAVSGNSLGVTAGASADELWYNPGDNFFYFGSTNAAVVDATTRQFLTYLPSAGGHTLAVDPNNNHIFAPVTGAGIKVFAQQ